MKGNRFFGIPMVFLCMCGLTGCMDDNEGGIKRTNYEEYTLTVASKKVPGVLFASGSNVLADVYAVKKEPSGEWAAFGEIDGFAFEEGYECRIRISETSYLDDRRGDPAWTEYDLLETISKEQKESEGVPPHFIPEWYTGGDSFQKTDIQ